MSNDAVRPDLTRMAGDPFVGLIVLVLTGLPTPAARLRWCREWLPMSSTMLDLDRRWESDTTEVTVTPQVVLSPLALVPLPPRRNFQPRICRRCAQSFQPTTGRQFFCTVCRAIRAPTPLSRSKVCVICKKSFMPKITRQRVCGPQCAKTLHNAAARAHWERRGAARQSEWYWVRGGKEAKQAARQARQAARQAKRVVAS
jgi:hypothetical protein